MAYTAERLASLGFLAEAERYLARLSEEPSGLPLQPLRRPRVLAARGTLAFARGDSQEAIPQLEESTAIFRDTFNQAHFLFISETLARAWQAQGTLPQAILVLEDATRERGRMMPFIENWMRARLYLAELYHQAGREQEALEVETELRHYCLHADPDFVIWQELEKRQQAAIEPLGA